MSTDIFVWCATVAMQSDYRYHEYENAVSAYIGYLQDSQMISDHSTAWSEAVSAVPETTHPAPTPSSLLAAHKMNGGWFGRHVPKKSPTQTFAAKKGDLAANFYAHTLLKLLKFSIACNLPKTAFFIVRSMMQLQDEVARFYVEKCKTSSNFVLRSCNGDGSSCRGDPCCEQWEIINHTGFDDTVSRMLFAYVEDAKLLSLDTDKIELFLETLIAFFRSQLSNSILGKNYNDLDKLLLLNYMYKYETTEPIQNVVRTADREEFKRDAAEMLRYHVMAHTFVTLKQKRVNWQNTDEKLQQLKQFYTARKEIASQYAEKEHARTSPDSKPDTSAHTRRVRALKRAIGKNIRAELSTSPFVGKTKLTYKNTNVARNLRKLSRKPSYSKQTPEK